MKFSIYILSLIFALVTVSACTQEEDGADVEEVAQQIGDVMASIDESGGSTGSLALYRNETSIYAKKVDALPGAWIEKLGHWLNPVTAATAEACSTATTFGSCTNNVITRDFNDCTVGVAVFSGTVTLNFTDLASDNVCQMTLNSHNVKRNPDFTVTGRRAAVLSVEKTGTNGQVITRTGVGQFEFTNDGIRRVFSLGNTAILDYTTHTTAAIGITGATRANRVVNGGTLRVTNNLNDMTCDYTPSSVAWSNSCNCADSGSWSGQCSDGSSSSLTITGCGSATVTAAGTTQNLTFDRCYSTN